MGRGEDERRGKRKEGKMRGEEGRGEDERRFQIVLIVRSDWLHWLCCL